MLDQEAVSAIKSKCPEWSLEDRTYPTNGPLHWRCKCGKECEAPDTGKARQQVFCTCGQGVIMLNTEREGWID